MPIKNGDTVNVHYTGTLADGTLFDSSHDRAPLEFVMGQQSLIPGFEAVLFGKEVGDSVRVTIPPDEAYGTPDEDMVFPVPLGEVPAHIHPEVGMMLQLSSDKGNMDVRIVNVTAEEIILDANHPLAGKALTFEIDVVSVA